MSASFPGTAIAVRWQFLMLLTAGFTDEYPAFPLADLGSLVLKSTIRKNRTIGSSKFAHNRLMRNGGLVVISITISSMGAQTKYDAWSNSPGRRPGHM